MEIKKTLRLTLEKSFFDRGYQVSWVIPTELFADSLLFSRYNYKLYLYVNFILYNSYVNKVFNQSYFTRIFVFRSFLGLG